MTIDAEILADRRRLRRKLTVWRVASFVGVAAALVAIGLAAAGRNTITRASDQIARISIGGFITGDQRLAELMRRVGEADQVKGVVVSINSPGGTTTGAEEIYRNLRALAQKKPLVAFVDGTAASGGYITAIAADHIVARETSLVGSIGVLFQYPDVSKLLADLGVSVQEVKSAPLKAEPSPFHPTSPEGRAALEQVVADTYAWFKGLVGERRRLSESEIATASTGQVFSGRQSVPLRLVDSIGAERDAVAWLEREKNVARDLPVRDWRPQSGRQLNLLSAAAFGADLAGFADVALSLRRLAEAGEAVRLDGLLAVWQPSFGGQ